MNTFRSWIQFYYLETYAQKNIHFQTKKRQAWQKESNPVMQVPDTICNSIQNTTIAHPLQMEVQALYYMPQLLNSWTMREEIIEPNIKYSKVGESRRQKLVDLVINKGFTVRRAAKVLKVNESTGKSIIKVFKKTGSTSLKTHKRRNVTEHQNTHQTPTENQHHMAPNIERQEQVPEGIPTQDFMPQLFYYYPQIVYLTFYMVFPHTIL